MSVRLAGAVLILILGVTFATTASSQGLSGVTFTDLTDLALKGDSPVPVRIVGGSSVGSDARTVVVFVDGVATYGDAGLARANAPALLLACEHGTVESPNADAKCRMRIESLQSLVVTVTAFPGATAASGTLVATADDGTVSRRKLAISRAGSTTPPPSKLAVRTSTDRLCAQFPVDLAGDATTHDALLAKSGRIAAVTVRRTQDTADCSLEATPSQRSAATQWTRFEGAFADIGSYTGTVDLNGKTVELTVHRTSSAGAAVGLLALGALVASALAFLGGRGRAMAAQRSARKANWADAVLASGALADRLRQLESGNAQELRDAIARARLEWVDFEAGRGRMLEELLRRYGRVDLRRRDLLFAGEEVFPGGEAWDEFSTAADSWVAAATSADRLLGAFEALDEDDRGKPLAGYLVETVANGPTTLDDDALSPVADRVERLIRSIREGRAVVARVGDRTPGEIASLAQAIRDTIDGLTAHADITDEAADQLADKLVAKTFELRSLLAREPGGPEGIADVSGQTASRRELSPTRSGVRAYTAPEAGPAFSPDWASAEARAARTREIAFVVVYSLLAAAASVLVGFVSTYVGKDVWGTPADRLSAFTWAFGTTTALQLLRYLPVPSRGSAQA